MTATLELEESTLRVTSAGRKTRTYKKNSNTADPYIRHLKVGSLYQYIELGDLIDAFMVRLGRLVPIDSLSFYNESLGQSYDKQLIETKDATNYLLEYKLINDDCYLGRLTIARRKQFLSAEVRCVNAAINALVGPLKNASMYWQACQSAYVDTLTGVPNRAALETMLSQQSNDIAAIRPVALVMCDVDRFKSINDNCGHKVGDMVIRQFASILKSNICKSDAVYRYGGDEFVIMFMKNTGAGATESAEQLRRSIEQSTLYAEQACIKLTATIGLTDLKMGESLDEAFLRADAALLSGKKNGKNQVVYG